MPLTVRYVEPRSVHSMPLLEAVGGRAPLQALGVQNLSSAIRQLSSVARHAEGIMGDIADTLASFHHRTVTLEARMEALRLHISSLDPERAGEKFPRDNITVVDTVHECIKGVQGPPRAKSRV